MVENSVRDDPTRRRMIAQIESERKRVRCTWKRLQKNVWTALIAILLAVIVEQGLKEESEETTLPYW